MPIETGLRPPGLGASPEPGSRSPDRFRRPPLSSWQPRSGRLVLRRADYVLRPGKHRGLTAIAQGAPRHVCAERKDSVDRLALTRITLLGIAVHVKRTAGEIHIRELQERKRGHH